MGLAQPERFVRLSLVGNEWQTVRERMKQLTFELRRACAGSWEWAWVCEVNPKGTGRHVHAWQRGEFVRQKALCALADGCGMGYNTDIRVWKPQGELSAAYGLKGLMYGAKAGAAEVLAANGGRLIHASKGYFLDGDGRPCGVKKARSDWAGLRGEQRDFELRWEPRWETKLEA
jgi:hypothetical protein